MSGGSCTRYLGRLETKLLGSARTYGESRRKSLFTAPKAALLPTFIGSEARSGRIGSSEGVVAVEPGAEPSTCIVS